VFRVQSCWQLNSNSHSGTHVPEMQSPQLVRVLSSGNAIELPNQRPLLSRNKHNFTKKYRQLYFAERGIQASCHRSSDRNIYFSCDKFYQKLMIFRLLCRCLFRNPRSHFRISRVWTEKNVTFRVFEKNPQKYKGKIVFLQWEIPKNFACGGLKYFFVLSKRKKHCLWHTRMVINLIFGLPSPKRQTKHFFFRPPPAAEMSWLKNPKFTDFGCFWAFSVVYTLSPFFPSDQLKIN